MKIIIFYYILTLTINVEAIIIKSGCPELKNIKILTSPFEFIKEFKTIAFLPASRNYKYVTFFSFDFLPDIQRLGAQVAPSRGGHYKNLANFYWELDSGIGTIRHQIGQFFKFSFEPNGTSTLSFQFSKENDYCKHLLTQDFTYKMFYHETMDYFVVFGSAQISSTLCEIGLLISSTETSGNSANDSHIIKKVLKEMQLDKFDDIEHSLLIKTNESKISNSGGLSRDLDYDKYYFKNETCTINEERKDNGKVYVFLIICGFFLIAALYGICIHLKFITGNCIGISMIRKPRQITPQN